MEYGTSQYGRISTNTIADTVLYQYPREDYAAYPLLLHIFYRLSFTIYKR